MELRNSEIHAFCFSRIKSIRNELKCSHAKLSLVSSRNSQRRKFPPQIVENSAPNMKVLLTVAVTHIYCGFLSVSCARKIKNTSRTFSFLRSTPTNPFHQRRAINKFLAPENISAAFLSCSIDLFRLQYRITYKVSFVALNFKCSRECATSDSHRRREESFVCMIF